MNPEACSDQEWGEYLYFRDNPRGDHREVWFHATGCRKFFNVVRNTLTYEIRESYLIGTEPAGDTSAGSAD